MVDAGSDLGDPAGRLVSEDDGQRARDRAVGHVQVRVTNATMLDRDRHLSGPRRLEFDVVDDGNVAARMLEQGGAHGREPTFVFGQRAPPCLLLKRDVPVVRDCFSG